MLHLQSNQGNVPSDLSPFICKKDAITFKEAPSRAVEKAKIPFPLEMVFILCKISKVFFLNLLCFSAIKAKE